jgi:hypothetical protein
MTLPCCVHLTRPSKQCQILACQVPIVPGSNDCAASQQAEQGALSASQAAAGEQQRRADAAETAHAQAAAQAAQLQQELDHMRVHLSAHTPNRVDAATGNTLTSTPSN